MLDATKNYAYLFTYLFAQLINHGYPSGCHGPLHLF